MDFVSHIEPGHVYRVATEYMLRYLHKRGHTAGNLMDTLMMTKIGNVVDRKSTFGCCSNLGSAVIS